jgi:protein TonB
MLLSFVAALGLHALVLLGLDFELPEPSPRHEQGMEVMLISRPGAADPSVVQESVQAQADRAGETTVPLPDLDEADPPTSSGAAAESPEAVTGAASEPLPAAPEDSSPEPEPPQTDDAFTEPAPADLPQRASETARPLTADESPLSVASARTASAADILASRSAEIARLTEQIQASNDVYRSRVRRKAISTSTREYRYAAYMEAWRRKVERIGNLNYPEEARRQGLYGSLILHVAVRADGSLEGVRVVRSSGKKVLDEAAVRIVELAAPFAPFPPDIRDETDVLDITRTWLFQRNNRLGWDG